MNQKGKLVKRILFFYILFTISFFSTLAQTPFHRQSPFQASNPSTSNDSICYLKGTLHKPKFGQFVMPLALFGSGFMVSSETHLLNKYEFREERNEHYSTFHTRLMTTFSSHLWLRDMG
jgi:hypothetical protein